MISSQISNNLLNTPSHIDNKFNTFNKIKRNSDMEAPKSLPNKNITTGTDRDFTNKVGNTFVISETLLGHGSYGDVFLATDETGKKVAVKCCKMDSSGIPNILETSIMSSMVHPHINRSLRIQASNTKLYIIQELAQTDLAEYTRRGKGDHKPTISELRYWCFCIAQAVDALHKENIIHADIKASNVLLYKDGSVRLTDFTLSTKKWDTREKFTHNVCTCTHRPLECFLRRPWDESLDIWSLGCTFYEIAYGEHLFPYQGNCDKDIIKDNQISSDEARKRVKDAKTRLRNRSINAIIDWSSRGPNPPTSYEIIGVTQYPIDFLPFVLCSDYKNPEMSVFNDLLCQMLIVDPSRRPTIGEVLSHPFFIDMKSPIYLSIKRPVNTISLGEQARVSRYIENYTSNPKIQSLALILYRRCNNLTHISEHIKAVACTWISSKLIVGYPPKVSLPPHQLLSTERDICHNLEFMLHVI